MVIQRELATMQGVAFHRHCLAAAFKKAESEGKDLVILWKGGNCIGVVIRKVRHSYHFVN